MPIDYKSLFEDLMSSDLNRARILIGDIHTMFKESIEPHREYDSDIGVLDDLYKNIMQNLAEYEAKLTKKLKQGKIDEKKSVVI